MNPLFSMFSHPRATMRYLLDTRGRYKVLFFLIILLGGFAEAFSELTQSYAYDELWDVPLWLIWLSLIGTGALVGLISVYLGAAIVLLTGQAAGAIYAI